MSQPQVNAVNSAETPEVRRKERRIQTPLDPPIAWAAQRFGGNKSKELERFLRFAVVGITGAFIDLGLLTLLQSTILPPARLPYTPLDFPFDQQGLITQVRAVPLYFNVAIATTLAFLAAVLSNFTWTSLWVYPESRTRSIRRQLSQFALISVIGWSARTLWITTSYVAVGALVSPPVETVVRLFEPSFDVQPVTEKQIGSIVAQLLAMFIVMLWNFFANRYWTFNDVD